MKNLSKIILVSVVLVSACSKEKATVSVTIPARPASLALLNNAQTMGGDMPAPASLAEVNCLAVNVMGADIPKAQWDQDNSTSVTPKMKYEHAMKGEPCAYGGVTSMIVPYNGTASNISLTVPVGSNRLFQLLGFKAPAGACDPQVDPGKFFSQMGKVEPTELGRTIASISGSTTINLNGKYDSTRNMHNCPLDSNGSTYWYTDSATRVTAGAPIRTAVFSGAGFVRKYFLYQDANRSGSLSVTMWDSNSNPTYSNITGNLTSSVPVSTGYDIAVDSTGIPWIVNPTTSTATVYKLSGGSWTIVGSALGMSGSPSCRLAADYSAGMFIACGSNGFPLLAYYSNGTAISTSVNIYAGNILANEIVLKYNPFDNSASVAGVSSSYIKPAKITGNSSPTVALGTITSLGQSVGTISSNSLSMGIKPDGNPIISYIDAGIINVKDCTSSCYSSTNVWTNRDSSLSSFSGMTSLTMQMTPQNEPVLMFLEGAGNLNAHILKMEIVGFTWSDMRPTTWISPLDSVNSNPWNNGGDSVGLSIGPNGGVQAIISNPSYGSAWMGF